MEFFLQLEGNITEKCQEMKEFLLSTDMPEADSSNCLMLKKGWCQLSTYIWVFPKIGVPQNGWFILENLIKMDDLGVPLFSETSIYFPPGPLERSLNWLNKELRFWSSRPFFYIFPFAQTAYETDVLVGNLDQLLGKVGVDWCCFSALAE